MKPQKLYTTLHFAIEQFNQNYQNKPQVISAINRHILPHFGLSISGSRLTNLEKQAANALTQNIDISTFVKQDLLNIIETSFEKNKLSKSKQKAPRSHLKFFIDFLEKNRFLKVVINEENLLFNHYLGNKKVIDKSYINLPQTKAHNPKIAINFDINYYQNLFKKYGKSNIQKELDRIQKELNDLSDFMLKDLGNRKPTITSTIKDIERLLGWDYLKTKDLSKVGFNSIIEVVNTRVNYFDFNKINEYFITKGRLDYEAKQSSAKTVNWLKDFFCNYGVKTIGTKLKYIGSVITLAKYLYKDITDEDEADNYEDITLLRRLCLFRKKLPQREKTIKNLPFTWQEILQVREALRVNADTHYTYWYDKKRGRTKRTKRPKDAIASDLMKFLMLCFLTIIPPDRIRTVAELSIGRTLKHGLKIDEGFISYDKLKDKSVAKYYIHLKPEDYKTGKTHGEFWGILPNPVFKNNLTFYDYLDKWIYKGWRELLLKHLDHDYIFVSKQKSIPICKMKTRINNIFCKLFMSKTGIPLYPHTLRHIFCTYIDQIDISPKERESIAFWMHHTPGMAKKAYTMTKLKQKLAPGLELMNKIENAELK